ncbi:MAG: metalloregulator ArsR/SmtB family transcription factor [Bacteroidales bacterium]|nr:metalloregulator ArsR/SmtB family transcription factor [Bacteroidales bacterium]
MNKASVDRQSKINEAVDKLKAIAHPIRLDIIELLGRNKKMTVTEIYIELNLEQAITSHHLGILRDKGILRAVRKGKNIYYIIKQENILKIIDCISESM